MPKAAWAQVSETLSEVTVTPAPGAGSVGNSSRHTRALGSLSGFLAPAPSRPSTPAPAPQIPAFPAGTEFSAHAGGDSEMSKAARTMSLKPDRRYAGICAAILRRNSS
jgi:hypothetical protein